MSRTTVSPVATRHSARVVGTPRWCIASLHRNSRTDERSTARPSARARVRRRARALELQLPARAVRADDLAERDRAAVAELPGPVAELVPAVARGVRLHAGQHAVAAEHLDRRADRRRRARDAEHLAHRVRPGQQPRRPYRGRIDARIAGVAHRARHVMRHRIARQLAHKAIIKLHVAQIGKIGQIGQISGRGATLEIALAHWFSSEWNGWMMKQACQIVMVRVSMPIRQSNAAFAYGFLKLG